MLVGLKKATMFDVTNDGSCIKIEDKANTVTKLKVGGSAGFTISYSGGKITFSANSGASPLRILEPNIGGIPEQVEHNKTGLLFEPTNVEQLKECILKYWNNCFFPVQKASGNTLNRQVVSL